MGLRSLLGVKEQTDNTPYGITEMDRKVPLRRSFDENKAVDGSKNMTENLPFLSIDGSRQFSRGDYIQFRMDAYYAGPIVGKVKCIEHRIDVSRVTNGRDFFGYTEIVYIHFEDSLSNVDFGFDMDYVPAWKLKNIEIVDEQAYKEYRNREENTLQLRKYDDVRRRVLDRNRQVRKELCLLNNAQISAVAEQIVMAYKEPTLEDYDREIENCANGLYENIEGVNPAKVVWQEHLYPVLKAKALQSDIDPQELVKQLTEYLRSYSDNN